LLSFWLIEREVFDKKNSNESHIFFFIILLYFWSILSSAAHIQNFPCYSANAHYEWVTRRRSQCGTGGEICNYYAIRTPGSRSCSSSTPFFSSSFSSPLLLLLLLLLYSWLNCTFFFLFVFRPLFIYLFIIIIKIIFLIFFLANATTTTVKTVCKCFKWNSIFIHRWRLVFTW